MSGLGGRQTGAESPFNRELASWLAAHVTSAGKRGARVALLRAESGTVLLDVDASKASIRGLAGQIEAIALEAAACLGSVTFALRCYAGKDTLGTKHFSAPSDGAGAGARPLIEAFAATATLLGHYEKLVSAQAARLERLEGGPSSTHATPRLGPLPEPNPATTQVAEKLGLLLPIVANAIATKFGIDVAAPAPSPEQEVARALLASLSEEQLATLLSVLRPEQLAALHALRERFATSASSEQGQKARAPDAAVPQESAEPDERSRPN